MTTEYEKKEKAKYKRRLKNEIKQYLEQMADSDCRSTASPFYYVINTEIERSVPLDAADRIVYYSNELNETFESKEEYTTYLLENDYSAKKIKECLLNDLTALGMCRAWEQRNMFLTEDEAKRHLKENAHHYSKNAHLFVKHAYRAPNLKKFLENLFVYFDVKEE